MHFKNPFSDVKIKTWQHVVINKKKTFQSTKPYLFSSQSYSQDNFAPNHLVTLMCNTSDYTRKSNQILGDSPKTGCRFF